MAPEQSLSGWRELRMYAAPEAVDAIFEVLRSHGVSGISIDPLAMSGPDEEITLGATCRICAYLPVGVATTEHIQAIETSLWHLAAFDLAPISPLTIQSVREEDWETAWKEHYHPVRIGERFVIKPSWRQSDPRTGDLVIELDPGMAFGTGLHPTTRMMLERMEKLDFESKRVLDVGTGSGILAIGASLLGASQVDAIDTDAIACRVASENVERNRVAARISVMAGDISRAEGNYDIVVCNIIASVIASIAPALAMAMRPNGVLLVSGIIAERAYIVEDAFASAGLQIHDEMKDGDWRCLSVRNA
jgi:ribosomal protein L11 methyltransferase